MRHPLSLSIAAISSAFLLSACGQDATSASEVAPSVTRSTIVTSDSSVIADGATLVLVTVVPRDAAGRAITGPVAAKIVATSGSVSGTEWNGDSVYTAKLTVPTSAGEDTVSASIQGKPLAKLVAVRLDPGPIDASRSELLVNDSQLLADGQSSTRVFIVARDANGNPIEGLTVDLTTSAGAVSQATDVHGGLYRAWLTAGTAIETATLSASLSPASTSGTRVPLASVPVKFLDPSAWRLRADLPIPVQNSGLTALNGALYLVGGDSVNVADDWPVSDVAAYDPATDRWTPRAPMPAARANVGAAEVAGKLYSVGGNDYAALQKLWMYDPALDTWTAKALVPTPRSFLAVAALNGLIYAAGGVTDDGYPTGLVEVYDPATDQWSVAASLTKPRFQFALVAANGRLYAIGGTASSTSLDVEEYDAATDSWRSRAGLPEAGSGITAAFVGGRIIVLGGRGQSTEGIDGMVRCRAYDPAADSWQSCPPMHFPRYGATAVVLNGVLYVTGGFASTPHGVGVISSVEAYTP
jgi:N-acetylneuraminic acid mutarotase